ncbi:MAG: glycosyltransferase [Diaphorobacter sp.]
MTPYQPGSSFYQSRHGPYYIVSPDFSQKTAGPRMLHYLCHILNELGYEAYITSQLQSPWLRTPVLTHEIQKRHKDTHRTPIAVYPEVIRDNPLQEPVVARWLLNKAGHLGGHASINPNDIIFYWDEWVLQGEAHSGRLFLPPVDERIFNDENTSTTQRTGFCYYAHKYLAFGGRIADTIRQNGINLCQEIPRSAEEIADILRSTKVLYCYEPSNMVAEAYACGCPSIFIQSDYLKQFNLEKYGIPTVEEACLDFSLVPDLPAERARHLAAAREQARQSVQNFIEVTQSAARAYAGLSTHQQRRKLAASTAACAADNGQPPLSQWLAERVPTPAQSRLMTQYQAKAPLSLTLFIRTQGQSGSSLGATLQSLAALPSAFTPQSIIVLGANAAHSQLPQLCNVAAITATEQLDAIHQLVQAGACDWLLVVNAGEYFTPSGLPIVMLELLAAPQCRAVFADALVPTDSGEPTPMFLPDFNLDMLLSCPANMARHWLFRRDVFLEAGGFDAAYAQAPEFELLLRLIEAGGLNGLAHIHEPLLVTHTPPLANNAHELAAIAKHLRARGYDNATVDASLAGRYRVLYGHQAQPLVSIIIPTRDQFALLERCVSSLLERTTYPHYEILLVDNGSTEPAACTWLDGLAALGEARIRVLRYPQPFNYAAMNNLGAREARGDYLVLLNNDTAIAQGDWLDALLNHAQRPEVGVVGAKLLYPNGQVQHAGLLLGLHGMAGYPFSGAEADAPGYMHRLEIDQNYSAVSAACLMVRRALYDELGGMDADAFPLICGDIDLCLRARAAGYLTVWTPHAVLLHEKGATLTSTPPEAFDQQRALAQDEMYRRWLPALAHDPAYNRNLSLQSTEFAVETDTRLNWDPLPWRPLPVVLAVNADAFGCGHYRIIHPGQAMANAGLADVRVSEYHYGPVEMERLRPDAWVLQRLVGDVPFETVRRTVPFTQAFKVAELDDYLLNLPMKNGHRGQLPQDMQRVLKRWLDLTDRLVVSTTPLAEAMAKLHRDIRVVHNRLPPERWGHLSSLRRQGQRPRVGWAGGSSHQGDLELIADVVKALAGEVEWVFLGMCPAPMRPYLHEHHTPVNIASYPHKLASLNLDLAVAPLEHNLFNDCKSNLKLLEYGACGYPVVCSDVAPYQCGLPVTRVKNRYKNWVDAIRMHLADLDASAASGDALRKAVHQHWMLEGAHLQNWLQAWLPD